MSSKPTLGSLKNLIPPKPTKKTAALTSALAALPSAQAVRSVGLAVQPKVTSTPEIVTPEVPPPPKRKKSSSVVSMNFSSGGSVESGQPSSGSQDCQSVPPERTAWADGNAARAYGNAATTQRMTINEGNASVTVSTKEVKSTRSSRSRQVTGSTGRQQTKIGCYSSAEFQNWLNTPIQKPKIKRSKKTNDDAFQVFQDFSDMVDNADWKVFFQKLYTGKFPHGYSYRNQTLFFRKRTKIEKLEILDSTRQTMSKVMNFFTMYGGYSSDKDDINIFDFMVTQTPQFEQWKEIRSKKTKQFFIQKYIEQLVDNYELNEVEKRILVDTVHTGFLLKTIDNGDIVFENKRITEIKTLIWNEEKREFIIPKVSRATKTTRKTVSEKVQRNTFASHWNKFVNHVMKNKNPSDDINTDVSAMEDLTDNIMTDTVTDTTVSMSVVSEI